MEPGEPGVQQEVEKTGEQKAWERRPFARTFDLIASEYGWTDDQILDLTMGRISQIREIVRERQAEDRRRGLLDREKEVRVLASYIAGSAGNKKGAAQAEKIRLAPPEIDPDTGKPQREIRYMPYEKALRWFDHE